MEAAKRVLRYLKGVPGQGWLLRSDSDLQVYAYCDADQGTCPLTRCSLSGYYVTIGGSPMLWKSKKQSTISTSSAEVQYRAMANATSELIWIKFFLASLWVYLDKPMKFYCDNQAALYTLQRIQSYMNEQNTLRQTVILFANTLFLEISKPIMFPQSIKWKIYL